MSVELNGVELNVLERTAFGKYCTKHLREEKKLPAVAYGLGKPALHFTIDNPEFLRAFPQIKSEKIIVLKCGEDSFKAVIKTIQRDPVSDLPIHIDFLLIEEGQKIKFQVPVEVVNQNLCLALKAGGFLNLVKRKIEVSCEAKDLPKSLKIDIKDAIIGTSIRVSDFIFPENVLCTLDSYFTIITIAGKKGSKVKGTEEEAVLEGSPDKSAEKPKAKSGGSSSDKPKKEEKKPKTATKK